MSLLNKIITSSLAENKAIEKLHDISYSAINGQRQEFKNFQPEGLIMPGQLNREKPLPAITKEMIEDYHQKEQELLTAPNMVDGRPMKYRGVNYELDLEAPVETKVLVEDTSELVGDRVYVSKDIAALNDEIKKTDENIKKMKSEMDEFGSNLENIYILNNEVTKIQNLQKQLKEKNKLYEFIENTIKTNEIKKKDIDKENAIIAQRNKSKLMQYERDLQQINRNRLSLQQQPNESEAQYYQRLKQIEKERYDPVLYKQRALNQNVRELKDKLGDLFEDTSFKENIIKNLSDEDKFLLNQSFDAAGKSFLDKYGYNNKSLNPKMVVAELVKPARAISITQKIFRGKKARQELTAQREREIRRNRRIAERAVLQDTLARGQEQRGRARLAEEDERQARAERVARIIANAETREQRLRREAREEQAAAQAAIAQRRIAEAQAMEEARRRTDVLLAEAAQEREAAAAAQQEERRRQIISMSEQEAMARAREREAELVRIRAAKKLQAALRNKKISQNYQNELNLNKQQEEMARQAAIENLNRQQQEYIQSRQNEYAKREQEKRQQAANTLSNAWRNRQANHRFVEEHGNRLKEKLREAAKILKKSARRQVYNTGWAQTLPEAREEALWEKARKLRNTQNRIAFSNFASSVRAPRNIRDVAEDVAAEAEAEAAAAEAARIEQLVAASEAAAARREEELSRLSTQPQQESRRSRRERSDKGQRRGPYSRQPQGRALDIREGRSEEQQQGPRTRSLSRAARTRRPEGQGLLRKSRLTKRKLVIKPEEKMKNRLRLVASQIEAGNTNPKLIIEVNDLYKQLYNIDNAYQYLSKNK